MSDIVPPRPALKVDIVSASPIEGEDALRLQLRTDSVHPLTLRLTRRQAAELMAMILAERSRPAPPACEDAADKPHA